MSYMVISKILFLQGFHDGVVKLKLQVCVKFKLFFLFVSFFFVPAIVA